MNPILDKWLQEFSVKYEKSIAETELANRDINIVY
jgi:hypothetical protein